MCLCVVLRLLQSSMLRSIKFKVMAVLPWAAGISGIVKPFDQLGVRGDSDFDHVRVRFHPEGPVMSEKQIIVNSVFFDLEHRNCLHL